MSQVTEQAVLVAQAAINKTQVVKQLALFDTSGDPFTPAADDHTHTGDEVVLTGYEAVSADAVAETDDVNTAIAKLEARIVALESA